MCINSPDICMLLRVQAGTPTGANPVRLPSVEAMPYTVTVGGGGGESGPWCMCYDGLMWS